MAKIYYSRKGLNQLISHMDGVRDAVHDKAKDGGDRARANLAEARASTHWHKIFGPDHLTSVSVSKGEVDSFFNLEAPNAMAIEFGHQPSGVFGPGGRYGDVDTQAPRGLYILTRASGIL